ncbi:TetR/AcrR family transcriptional regulator [Campylobacter sp. US33a]|uniref:TetR/AcrR family transcriptional regulator n=1 Tax=Campylobacter sp. CCS1377 TaxID=3158229 RepID=A0AAU7E5G8_9BACT|nr:TetR/AcrR family transcriptional regulator [Campylobacter sp. US33a]TEY03499.1 TetR/AcrR family transcriptional regulator [Campylobacter sp. US33a]
MQEQNKPLTKKNLARREKIKAIALQLFLQKGYDETSLSEIIKQANGSFSNIYDFFTNKEGLFFEILSDLCKEHAELISFKMGDIYSNELEDVLRSFGMVFVEIFNQTQVISIGKIIFSRVYDSKQRLAKWLDDDDKMFARNVLNDYFSKSTNNFIANNAKKLSEIFCTMLIQPFHNLHILTDLAPMNKAEQEEHVDFVVRLFLNGIPTGNFEK